MPNMSLKKNEMPSQAPDVRNKNFKEVALGYTEEQAIDEANRSSPYSFIILASSGYESVLTASYAENPLLLIRISSGASL